VTGEKLKILIWRKINKGEEEMSGIKPNRTFLGVAVFLVIGIFIFSAMAMAGVVSNDHLRAKSSVNAKQGDAIKGELMSKDGGSLVTGRFIAERRGKGLIDYLSTMIQRIAINNGTAHGNNYDAAGNLIQTQMNLKMTAAITEALKPFGIQIVQHGVTGTPIKDLPALRAIGIRAAHVGTNWQNIIWETLVAEAQAGNPTAKSIVNRMIEATIAKTPDAEKKYKVSLRSEEAKSSVYVLGKDKNLDKLLGKELKNILGDFSDELVGLPADLVAKIDAATEKSATEHMLGFGSDGTADMVKDFYQANGLTYPEDFSSIKGFFAFKAQEGTDKTTMCCNIRNSLTIRGIMRAAKKTRSMIVFQKAMSEFDYTYPGGYSPENAAKFEQEIKKVAREEDFHDFMIKGDHITVKVDDAFLKDQAAQDSVAALFEQILEEKDIAKREAMFNAALKDEALNSAPGVAKALKAVSKAMILVKKEVASDFTVFALDASFMPTRLNVLVSAYLAGFIPAEAGLEAEVGEIGGKENSTVADAIEFITGIRYKEQVITDRQGVKYSQLVGPKRIGVLTGGGPASGHNAVIAAMVRWAAKLGIEIVAIPEGWAGLTKDELAAQSRVITLADVEKWEKKGGTLIKTSRTNPYKKAGEPQKVWENIQKLNLDGLVTLGGDDTNGVTAKLQAEHPDFLFIGLPKTMDNDVALPESDAQTYGFDSFTLATATALEAGKIDAISTSRILIVEVFGRSAGFVAARIGALIGATRTLIPEELVDLPKLVDDLRNYYAKNKYGVVVVAEGASLSVDGFKLNDNGELEVLKPDDANVKLLLAAFKSDPVAKAAFIKSMKAEKDSFGHKKLENVGLIVSAVVKAALKEDKENKIDISMAGKADYLFRSADTSKLDLEMTAMLGKAAVEKIADIQNNQLLYAYKGQIKSIPFAQELGGRVLDYTGAHRDEYLLANLALIDDKTEIELPDAATNEALFQDVQERFDNLQPSELLSLSLGEMKAVLWKLNTAVKKESGDNQELIQSIRRIANYMDDAQLAQMKKLADIGVFARSSTLEKLEMVSATINELGFAANGLIYRAGAHGGFYREWERGVNMAALKSMKGPKEADAAEFVRQNSRYTGVFTPYRIDGMRALKDERRVIDGVAVDFIFIPADKNIGRPEMKVPYFGPETTDQQVLDTMKKLGTPADVAAYYGPTSDTTQPRIFKEFIDAGIPVVAASPVNSDAVKAMLKEKFAQEGIAADQIDKMVSKTFKEGLYSVTRKEVGPDVLVVDTLSCTSNAMISVIKAMWDRFGIDHGNGLTVHSQTDSNATFPKKSGRARDPLDVGRGDSIIHNIMPASTGGDKNLFKIIPELKGKFRIRALRTGTVSASYWTLDMDLKTETTADEVRAALKDFALNDTDGVVKFYEPDPEINAGPLDTNAVVGWNSVSIIESLLIEMLDNNKTVHIQGLYDNQNAAPEQMVGKWAPWMVDGRRMRKLVEKFGDKSAQQDGGSFKTVDRNMFNKMAQGFIGFKDSLKNVKSVKAGLIINARAVIKNAGTAETLRNLKQASPDLAIVIWADTAIQADQVKAMGLEDIASIELKQLATILTDLNGQGISNSRIALVHAFDIIHGLRVTESALLLEKGIKVVNIEAARNDRSVNSMPLVVAKAVTSVMKDQPAVVESYNKMTRSYRESGQISQEELGVLNELTSDFSSVPLVKVSEEVARIQVTYEETVSKI
jgi:6-phosphofructokinase/glyceraldehyde-3-phosphate dehydrogenase/erythrose-4-phosphate dehydrogenase/fructose/tagatose bisphosphate aldolase